MSTAAKPKPKTRVSEPAPKITSSSDWQELGVHYVTLPSSAAVKIRIPDITLLIAADAVPEELRVIAYEEMNETLAATQRARRELAGGEPEEEPAITEERLLKLAQLNRYLMSQMLVDPPMTVEELGSAKLPSEDILMLTEFATRERVVDARGVALGVEPIDRWDTWVQAHDCPDNCHACLKVVRALSSVIAD
jgi:hypothetical protein